MQEIQSCVFMCKCVRGVGMPYNTVRLPSWEHKEHFDDNICGVRQLGRL